jgi:hypothetical protein
MVGSVLDTFRAFRLPFALLFLVLLASLYLGLSKRFTFTSAATMLPMGPRKRVDIVMAPSTAGVPARGEPGSHESVVHRFAADETGVVATGARSVLRSEIWVEVETPEGSGWVNAEFVTEQVSRSTFVDGDEPHQVLAELVTVLDESGDLGTVTGGHDLHVAHYAPPVRFASGSLRRLLAKGSVYWWWAPTGDTPKYQGTVTEAVGDHIAAAYRNRAGHVQDPEIPLPIEFVNLHSLVVGSPDTDDGWRIFFRYEDDTPLIAGIMRESLPNAAAMHGRQPADHI